MVLREAEASIGGVEFEMKSAASYRCETSRGGDGSNRKQKRKRATDLYSVSTAVKVLAACDAEPRRPRVALLRRIYVGGRHWVERATTDGRPGNVALQDARQTRSDQSSARPT